MGDFWEIKHRAIINKSGMAYHIPDQSILKNQTSLKPPKIGSFTIWCHQLISTHSLHPVWHAPLLASLRALATAKMPLPPLCSKMDACMLTEALLLWIPSPTRKEAPRRCIVDLALVNVVTALLATVSTTAATTPLPPALPLLLTASGSHLLKPRYIRIRRFKPLHINGH